MYAPAPLYKREMRKAFSVEVLLSPTSPFPFLRPFWGNVRLGGHPTGTKNFRTERLDEYVGDCVNSTAFPARSAFVGTNLPNLEPLLRSCPSSEHNLVGTSTRQCPGGEQVWR